MMRLLALDTATPASTVAVHDGDRVLASRQVTDTSQHAEVLAVLVRDVLAEADVKMSELTHIACGVGPGPFTGLRVGLATAKTMGYALGIPVVGICSLDAIARAHQASRTESITVVTGARRHEFYWASYDTSGTRIAGPEVTCEESLPNFGALVGTPSSPAIPDAHWIAQIAVEAMARGEETAPSGAVNVEQPAGGDGTRTADFIRGRTLLAAEALYLRRPDAVPPISVVSATAPRPNVRVMRWWDIDAVSALEPQLFSTTAWSAGTFWSELAGAPDTRHYVVAEEAGQIVGYAGITIYPPEAEVQTIAVAPWQQRHGTGRALLENLIGESVARSCRRMLLEVRADNIAAISLYESFGFLINGRRRDYYGAGQDAVLMQRDAQ
ncbi:MAG: tRNA (adenosine(37)-N6)-threonylcarbamoyltransferase complex dimerization subunit type 1 TsaB [Actinobacteria bacterium]|nr:tRNA (adenosine(37)-N6)-threonylcarbamoyltransferase complex dimerization subunit type 1 TsaB [Actinomycetota bacterium]